MPDEQVDVDVHVDDVGRGRRDVEHVEPRDGDPAGGELDLLAVADPLVRALPVDLDGADRAGHLVDLAGLRGEPGPDRLVGDAAGGRGRGDLALGVVGDRGLARAGWSRCRLLSGPDHVGEQPGGPA